MAMLKSFRSARARGLVKARGCVCIAGIGVLSCQGRSLTQRGRTRVDVASKLLHTKHAGSERPVAHECRATVRSMGCVARFPADAFSFTILREQELSNQHRSDQTCCTLTAVA